MLFSDFRPNRKLKAWYTTKTAINPRTAVCDGLSGLIMSIDDMRYSWKIVEIDFNNQEVDDTIERVEGELIISEEYKKFSGSMLSDN
jgi:GLPGLI family protein